MDPLGVVFIGKGAGEAVFLGDPTIDTSALDARLAALSRQRANERKSFRASMDKLLKFEKTGWFKHDKTLTELRTNIITKAGNIYRTANEKGQDAVSDIDLLELRELKDDFTKKANYSLQLRDLYKIGNNKIDGRQEDLTAESVEAWASYWSFSLNDQMQTLPPTLVEKKEVADYYEYIDEQASDLATQLIVTTKDGKKITSKRPPEVNIKLGIEDIIASPKGKFAIMDLMQNRKMTREESEDWIGKRYRAHIDSVYKEEKAKSGGAGFNFNFNGAGTKQFTFEYDIITPSTGIGTVLVPGAEPAGKFEEIRFNRNDATENKPISLRDPDDPNKRAEILVIPTSIRRAEGSNEWVLVGKRRIDEYGSEYSEEYEIPYRDVKSTIAVHFDHFDVDSFMRGLNEFRGENKPKKGEGADLGFGVEGSAKPAQKETETEQVDLGF